MYRGLPFAPRALALRLSIPALVLFGGSAAALGQGDIRGVDFRDYTYQTGVGGEKIKVVDGKYERDSEDDRLYFEVRDVVFGDITGDGKDEAAVTTLENTGGTGVTDVLSHIGADGSRRARVGDDRRRRARRPGRRGHSCRATARRKAARSGDARGERRRA